MNKYRLNRFCVFLLFVALLTIIPLVVRASETLPLKAEADKQLVHAKAHEPGLFDIDTGILFSQTINFLILLFIIKKLLFEKIGKLLENRQKEIGRLRLDTEKENKEVQDLKAKYESLIEKIDEEAYVIKQKAIQDVKESTLPIIEEAKKKAEEIIEKGEMDLYLERQTAWAQIREQLVELTALATEKVLEDSLDDEMHRKIIARSIEKIEKDLPDHKGDKRA